MELSCIIGAPLQWGIFGCSFHTQNFSVMELWILTVREEFSRRSEMTIVLDVTEPNLVTSLMVNTIIIEEVYCMSVKLNDKIMVVDVVADIDCIIIMSILLVKL